MHPIIPRRLFSSGLKGTPTHIGALSLSHSLWDVYVEKIYVRAWEEFLANILFHMYYRIKCFGFAGINSA
jgi:hypothetical protein